MADLNTLLKEGFAATGRYRAAFDPAADLILTDDAGAALSRFRWDCEQLFGIEAEGADELIAKFMADAEKFRHDMVFKMNDYLSRAAANLNGSNSASNFMIANEDVFAIVPPFRYEPPALGATLRGQAWNLGLLGLWLAVAVGLAWAATNRMTLEKT